MAIGLSVSMISCSKGDVDGSDSNDTQASATYMDVSYGTDPKQKMDLYLPGSRTSSTRTIVIIHGGGWTAGDKADFNSYIDEIKKLLPDYAYANVNYRLATAVNNHFPTQENDIKSAIQFLKDNSAKYSISGDFVLIGISAGAQLALLQGYKHADVAKPLGLVSYFGPTDLERLYLNTESSVPPVIKSIANASLEQNPGIFFESSPINYVSAQSAPTLLLHGDKDALVPLEQAVLLRDKLQNAGVEQNLVIYPGQGHDGWTLDALHDSFQRVAQFIKGL
jgi:acetyl esterase/lipase